MMRLDSKDVEGLRMMGLMDSEIKKVLDSCRQQLIVNITNKLYFKWQTINSN